MAKMTDRELIRLALIDASRWRASLADANGLDTVAGREAERRAAQYREILSRKYGAVTPAEAGYRRVELNALLAGLKMAQAK